MTLPLALRRWRRQLDIFPSDIAASVGHLMPPLASLLASSQVSDRIDGEPDGFDGIGRRGPYERLLATEWGIKRVAPLEFMRRSAENEQSFFELAYGHPAPRRGSVVLLDSGPEQLGACRIAQLALLVLLQERALGRGARFRWQNLVSLGEELFSAFDESSVRAFLQARSPLSPSPESLRTWQARFPEEELWLIGSPRTLSSRSKSTQGITLAERPAPGDPVVEVNLLGARVRQVTLQIPKAPIATRLLRNPFDAQKKVSAPQLEEHGDFLINPQGTIVFFRVAEGRVGWLHAQRSPTALKYLAPATQMSIIGVGTGHKRTYWLSASAGLVALQSSKPLIKGGPPIWLCPGPLLPPHQRLWPLEMCANPLSVVFVASDASLWRVEFERQTCKCIASGVSALTSLGGGTVAATVAQGPEGKPCVMIVEPKAIREVPFEHAGAVTHLRAVDGHALVLGRPEGEKFHVARLLVRPEYHWKDIVLRPPANTTVIDVDARANADELGLFLLDEKRRSISAVGRSHSRVLATSSTEISRAVVSSWHARGAYSVRNGTIGFFNPNPKSEDAADVEAE